MDFFTTKLTLQCITTILSYMLFVHVCCVYVYSLFFLIIVLLFSWEAVDIEPLKIAVFTPVFCELHTVCSILFICVCL
jgi:hypothetical protein